MIDDTPAKRMVNISIPPIIITVISADFIITKYRYILQYETCKNIKKFKFMQYVGSVAPSPNYVRRDETSQVRPHQKAPAVLCRSRSLQQRAENIYCFCNKYVL